MGVKLSSPDILREGLRSLWNAVLSGMPWQVCISKGKSMDDNTHGDRKDNKGENILSSVDKTFMLSAKVHGGGWSGDDAEGPDLWHDQEQDHD